MNEINVSVLVASYSPDLEKMERTLYSILVQKDIKYEIIISDDGSKEDYFEEISRLFSNASFENFKLRKNCINKGTVKNCLYAALEAKGKYIYMTSPGDMLADKYVLHDFYNFADKNNIKICFGLATYYRLQPDGKAEVLNCSSRPEKPFIYSNKFSGNFKKISFLFGRNVILGAVYFRERESCIKYLKIVRKSAVYAEDCTTTAFAMFDGIYPYFYNRQMTLYEFGEGISTGKSKTWDTKLETDYDKTYLLLRRYYPYDSLSHILAMGVRYKNKWYRRILQTIRSPIAALQLLRYRLLKKQIIKPSIHDIESVMQKNKILAQRGDIKCR